MQMDIGCEMCGALAVLDTTTLKEISACSTKFCKMDPLKGDPEDALEVMSIPPMGAGALSVTPFGGKVEVMLRLAGLEYRAVKGDPGNKKLTPKGKVRCPVSASRHTMASDQSSSSLCGPGVTLLCVQFPVLRHGNNIVPDSSAIFEYLKSTYPSEMSVFSPPDAKTCVSYP